MHAGVVCAAGRVLRRELFVSLLSQAVLGAKGGDAVLQAMRSFPTAVELQCEGCVAVINLVKHNLAGASQLADAGAATCIVDAMRIHTVCTQAYLPLECQRDAAADYSSAVPVFCL
eukprot:5235943-Pleurochrysis_carterae.AAC.4